eukprot:804375-Rhodomonas_salina.1
MLVCRHQADLPLCADTKQPDDAMQIRGKATATKNDLEQKCFVTGVDRHTFNQFPGEWEIRRGGKYAL